MGARARSDLDRLQPIANKFAAAVSSARPRVFDFFWGGHPVSIEYGLAGDDD